MRASAVLFLCGALLAGLAAEANHALSALHVALYVGGLLVAGNALRLPFGTGFAVSAALGALCDAAAPASLFGLQTLLFAAAHTVLFASRDRLPREVALGRVAAALFANLAIFVAISAVVTRRFAAPGAAWLRLGSDLVASQAAVAVLVPWYFALQTRALELAGIDAGRLLE